MKTSLTLEKMIEVTVWETVYLRFLYDPNPFAFF